VPYGIDGAVSRALRGEACQDDLPHHVWKLRRSDFVAQKGGVGVQAREDCVVAKGAIDRQVFQGHGDRDARGHLVVRAVLKRGGQVLQRVALARDSPEPAARALIRD